MSLQDFHLAAESLIQENISQGVIPGGVLGAIQGQAQDIRAHGDITFPEEHLESRWLANVPQGFKEIPAEVLALTGRQVQEDQIYDCASITKSIPLAFIVLKLLDKGELQLDDTLSSLFPQWPQQYSEVRIWNLLTHTLDFRFSLGQVARADSPVIETILAHPFKVPPGEIYVYSNSSSVLLTLALEQITGKKFQDLARELVFEPLGLESSSFNNPDAAPTEYCPWRQRLIRGEVHDESASSLRPHITGAAGLFSNVPDIMKVLSILIECHRGESNYLSSSLVASLLQNQIPQLGTTSLGMELNESRFMGAMGQQFSCIGKTGFTGTHWQLALEEGVGICFLTNYPWPRRLANADAINSIRNQLGDLAADYLF